MPKVTAKTIHIFSISKYLVRKSSPLLYVINTSLINCKLTLKLQNSANLWQKQTISLKKIALILFIFILEQFFEVHAVYLLQSPVTPETITG